MRVEYTKIKDMNISFFHDFFDFSEDYNYEQQGYHHLAKQTGEHYKLLTYLSYQYNNITILDVGTNTGESAVALSQNKSNRVITYDIEKKFSDSILNLLPNLEFRQKDINLEEPEVINSAHLILLDIAHDGFQEKKFTDFLIEINFGGILICDDINNSYFPLMNPWWNSIDKEKYDISEIGHAWGTGIVNFSNVEKIEIIK